MMNAAVSSGERDLQAQKVLGEGVFAMVRRSRELRGLI